MFSLIPAISCGDITLQNIVLTPNPYINTFGSVVTYKCLPNYQFIDVDSDSMETVHQRISRCDETGHWSPALVDCAGVLKFIVSYPIYLLEYSVTGYNIRLKQFTLKNNTSEKDHMQLCFVLLYRVYR